MCVCAWLEELCFDLDLTRLSIVSIDRFSPFLLGLKLVRFLSYYKIHTTFHLFPLFFTQSWKLFYEPILDTS